MDVRVHIGRSTGRSAGRSTPQYWHLVVKNSKFTFLLWEFILTYQLADLPLWYWYLMVKMSSNLADLPLDLLADQTPHTDNSWSRMAISHCYWHQVVKNGNFTLLLTSSGQEWQLADLPPICQQIYPQMHHGIYYGMYLAAILDSARKGGNFLSFLNNEISKQSVSIVQSCQM